LEGNFVETAQFSAVQLIKPSLSQQFDGVHAYAQMLVDLFRTVKAETDKPFVLCWVAASDQALKLCREAGIPVLRGAEPAVEAVAGLIGYAQARRAWLADRAARAAVTLPALSLPAPGVVGTIEATRLLEACGVSSAPIALAPNAASAASAAATLGWPVAVKIESPDILHKTEADGVKLGLGDAEALILRNHGALTVGRTVGEAFNWLHRLELSCRSQLAAMACNTPLVEVSQAVLEATWNNYQRGTRRPFGVMEWPGLLRKLDRIDPSYRT
jgi:hypothetical protein